MIVQKIKKYCRAYVSANVSSVLFCFLFIAFVFVFHILIYDKIEGQQKKIHETIN